MQWILEPIASRISTKADKVSNAVSGNFAGLDANGNLIDSGYDQNDFIPASEKSSANGVASLDENGKVPASQLPSYVDDVLEYANVGSFPLTGESGKIYVAIDTNKTYRWGGSSYTEISESLALGETSSTAYRGDRGKTAYDHAAAKGSAFSSGLYKITTNAEGHVTAATAVQKSDITELGVLDKEYEIQSTDELLSKTWNGLTSFNGNYIWTDGENIYYSYDPDHYVLDKSTSTWNQKIWNGYTNINGNNIWTDGEHIYFSSGSKQYVLDKTTSTWNAKTWNGYTDVAGAHIWSDGTNIYYSNSLLQYVLNKETSTWNAKTWNGLTDFVGKYIWTDGENTYYSTTMNQYILDKTTSTWNAKTWNGFGYIGGDSIWSNGENIYYSSGSNQYVLDKSTSTWSTKTWNGLTEFSGYYIWTDGENTYFSLNTSQYKIYFDDGKRLLIGNNGELNTVQAKGIILPTVTSLDNGKILRVEDGEWIATRLDNASGVSF